jgi:rhomboid protease GluP
VVIFAASVFSNLQERVIPVYGFIPNHLFYNEPDAANRIGFDEQKSLPFFSSGFSLETLARLFSSMFIHAGVFHLSWNLCAALSGRLAERSIGVPRHIFVYLISGIAGVCCMEQLRVI